MSWRDTILRYLNPEIARVTAVADPDGLLLEEEILDTILKSGFDLIRFGDPISFRFTYEKWYRDIKGGEKPLLIVIAGQAEALKQLPYDVYQGSRHLFFSLAMIFPKLSYPVIEVLPKSELNKLYRAYRGLVEESLGEKKTKEFILKYVYTIQPELIHSPLGLFKMLLSRHYNSFEIPPLLDDYLIEALKGRRQLRELPLGEIVRSKEKFFACLESKWEEFVEGTDNEFPFADPGIKVYLDNLFAEGYLKPVKVDNPESLPKWALPGIIVDREKQNELRVTRIMERLSGRLCDPEMTYRKWRNLARLWAGLMVECHKLERAAGSGITALGDTLNERFTAWLLERYGSLIPLSWAGEDR